MKTVRELLREGDPLRYEPVPGIEQRNLRRRAVLAAATGNHAPVRTALRPWLVVAVIALLAIAGSFIGTRLWPRLITNVQAAVRFEVRLAEDQPAAGLRKAKVAGTNRSVYLHDEVVVNNSDIAAAQVVAGVGPSTYGVSVEFNAAGSAKMRAATADHMGKHLAILLDGEVVMTPVIRTPIDASALISGDFTKAQAERIASGIGRR